MIVFFLWVSLIRIGLGGEVLRGMVRSELCVEDWNSDWKLDLRFDCNGTVGLCGLLILDVAMGVARWSSEREPSGNGTKPLSEGM